MGICCLFRHPCSVCLCALVCIDVFEDHMGKFVRNSTILSPHSWEKPLWHESLLRGIFTLKLQIWCLFRQPFVWLTQVSVQSLQPCGSFFASRTHHSVIVAI